MELEIRVARADDRGPIAELILSSGPDINAFLYGERALEFLRHEFASGRGFAGHPNVTVAVLDGEVVGTGCFYDRDSYGALSRGTVKNFFSCFGTFRGASVLLRARHIGSIVRRPKPSELYLSNFGVAAHLRSHGIGSKLIAHKIAEARQRGYRIFGLDVSVENPRGQALYTRLGLSVKKEKAFALKDAGVTSARKMELSL
jgi:ribosomal protein S18 acetylase RimI-like enzyme